MFQDAHKRKLINAPIVAIGENNHVQTVLLETGTHDDAVRYFARLRSVSYAGEYLVYVAESSLLLDLVRFKRTMEIMVSFSPEARFEGILSLAKVPTPDRSQAPLALTLTKPAPLETECSSEGCCPIT